MQPISGIQFDLKYYLINSIQFKRNIACIYKLYYILRWWQMDSANARKFSAALGMSILFARLTGFPWSFDSA
jgi:hypothetical protein